MPFTDVTPGWICSQLTVHAAEDHPSFTRTGKCPEWPGARALRGTLTRQAAPPWVHRSCSWTVQACALVCGE